MNRASAAAAPISPRASGEALSYRCESEGAWLPEPGAATSWCGEERRALLRPPEKRRTGAGGSCSTAASCAWLFLPNRARGTTTGGVAAVLLLLVRRAGAERRARRERAAAAAGIAEKKKKIDGNDVREASEQVERKKRVLRDRWASLTRSFFFSFLLSLHLFPPPKTMDETYDAIVLGTGLKECILSGLLSVDGLKVRGEEKERGEMECKSSIDGGTSLLALFALSLSRQHCASSAAALVSPAKSRAVSLVRSREALRKEKAQREEQKRKEKCLARCLLSLSFFSLSTLFSSTSNLFSLSFSLFLPSFQVLHLDRNPYYGGDSASLNLNQLYERHAPKKPAAPAPPPAAPAPPPPPAPEAATSTTTAEGGEGEEGAAASAAAAAPPPPPPPPPPAPPAPPPPPPPAPRGPSRDYNVDTVPKFIMGGGKLVRVLVRTKVTRYLEFKAVDGSFVFSSGRVERVPATDMEALRSPLLGLLEKRRARNFFIFVQDYKEEDPRTHGGRDLRRMPMSALYAEFGLAPATVDFVGHALALHTDDTYMNRPALDTVKRIQLYHDSLFR